MPLLCECVCVCVCLWHISVSAYLYRVTQNKYNVVIWSRFITERFFPCHLVWVYTWSGFRMGTAEDASLTFFTTIVWKNRFLVTSPKVNFQTLSVKISHHIYIVRISSSQHPARSAIIWFLVEVVYWHCGLEFVYPEKFSFTGDNCQS